MRVFRYRALSPFLFKELHYREIYLASPSELNDPLDLDKQIDFAPPNEGAWRALCSFLNSLAVRAHPGARHWPTIVNLLTYNNLGLFLKKELSLDEGQSLNKERLYTAILRFYNLPPLTDLSVFDGIRGESLCEEVDSICRQVIGNSAVACFSTTNDDFLMWSHYASGHSGICLEFEIEEPSVNEYEFRCEFLESHEGRTLGWNESIYPVKYRNTLSMLPFFEFFPVFNEMGDVDLVNLSKSYWHPYAHAIRDLFLEKLNPWQSENEWRIVQVNFKPKTPEERIYHYPRTALKGIYFGAKATQSTKQRVRQALRSSGRPTFYQGSVDGSRQVQFKAYDFE